MLAGTRVFYRWLSLVDDTGQADVVVGELVDSPSTA